MGEFVEGKEGIGKLAKDLSVAMTHFMIFYWEAQTDAIESGLITQLLLSMCNQLCGLEISCPEFFV